MQSQHYSFLAFLCMFQFQQFFRHSAHVKCETHIISNICFPHLFCSLFWSSFHLLNKHTENLNKLYLHRNFCFDWHELKLLPVCRNPSVFFFFVSMSVVCPVFCHKNKSTHSLHRKITSSERLPRRLHCANVACIAISIYKAHNKLHLHLRYSAVIALNRSQNVRTYQVVNFDFIICRCI